MLVTLIQCGIDTEWATERLASTRGTNPLARSTFLYLMVHALGSRGSSGSTEHFILIWNQTLRRLVITVDCPKDWRLLVATILCLRLVSVLGELAASVLQYVCTRKKYLPLVSYLCSTQANGQWLISRCCMTPGSIRMSLGIIVWALYWIA
jgi:hypothetical protein